ncbi:Bgt-417 [Blumeria graminis f. sp. tritici]|uniref:triacylglycerol lipase n=2 Tax=Blumeria graminis f. sp. tritici TaxID=62690 RepID=A0A9X9MFF6_BLUGR|nr:Lipase [Blumeria graminis f. sp. tritici 96224]VDB84362.1 Bgt-417 [Blumeria graminis f. sp. tritici]
MILKRNTGKQCTSVSRVTVRLLLSLLAISKPIDTLNSQVQQHPLQQPVSPNLQTQNPNRSDHLFTLRHVFHHGDLSRPASFLRSDVRNPERTLWIETEGGKLKAEGRQLVVKTSPVKINRLKNRHPSVVDPMVAAARQYSQVWTSNFDAWSLDEISAPDVSDKDTVLSFAHMAANAYHHHENDDGEEIYENPDQDQSIGFGWDSDGLRGYLYADETNSTIVIGLKGTSMAVWDGAGTTRNDKENDNLYFSCCCGQQSNFFYREVCNCATGTYTCNLTCLRKSLLQENRYYAAGRNLYKNVTALYPNASIWLTGHSLGGAISAMIGLTYGAPVLTFEAVPDALPANRLGLPTPIGADPDRPSQRNHTGIFHFGHTADPIYMGTCNGFSATCSYAGYALESACHTGQECVWDTVAKNGTGISVMTHRIIYVIENIIKKWDRIPKCGFVPDCYDCALWKQVTGDISTTLSKSSVTSTKTRTRTSTCQTPGWWGCLDTTTTNPAETLTSRVTTTTSTCETPGWFGCLDKPTAFSGLSSFLPARATPGLFNYGDASSLVNFAFESQATSDFEDKMPTITDPPYPLE